MNSIRKSTCQAEITSPTLPVKSPCVFLGHPTLQSQAKLRMHSRSSQALTHLSVRYLLQNVESTGIAISRLQALEPKPQPGLEPEKKHCFHLKPEPHTGLKQSSETEVKQSDCPSQRKSSAVRQPWS